MKVFVRVTLLIGVVLLFGSIFPSESEASSKKPKKSFGQIERVDVITEVLPEGEKVVALSIEYKKAINNQSLSASTYKVNGLHGENADERKVTNVYANTSPELSSVGKDGKFVIIELDTNDPIAGTLHYDFMSGINTRLDLEYTVTQEKNIRSVIGNNIPTTPNVLVHTDEINLVVDDFMEKTFSNEEGNSLNYRLFEPTSNGELQPLVLFLHGAGERGSNNDVQLLGNRGAISWAAPEQQMNHSAYVVAPQVEVGGWWDSGILMDLISTLKEEYPIDPDRVYVTGVSMGGIGTWALIQNHPEVFAGAIPVCGVGDVNQASQLVNLPIWALHSIDDFTVPITGSTNMMAAIEAAGAIVTRSEFAGNLDDSIANQEAQKVVDMAKINNSHTLYTGFTPGTTPINSHFSWIPTYENEVVRDWLFTNVRDK